MQPTQTEWFCTNSQCKPFNLIVCIRNVCIGETITTELKKRCVHKYIDGSKGRLWIQNPNEQNLCWVSNMYRQSNN